MTACLKFSLVAMPTLLLSIGFAAQEAEEFRIDPASSSIMLHVGRAGVFRFAGHDHEVIAPKVDGRVVVNRSEISRSSVQLRIDAEGLKVTGKGEPAQDVAEVQRVMLSERVLDVARYPQIVFESSGVSPATALAADMSLRVDGRLSVHGTSRRVMVPVRVRLTATGLAAEGRLTVRQTEFGMQPVTAGAGTVRVKDEVDIVFRIVATRP